MILVGLTGGIGSGKSSVSELLAAKGAISIDADLVTREVQQPGSPVLAAIAERFGDGVLLPDGALDRARLASIVFNDPDALKDLNGIVHPAVSGEILRRAAALGDTDHVVVLDIPLLVEGGRYKTGAVVVVDVPVDVAVERLVQFRGFDEADAKARIERQVSREKRLAAADRVIDNAGDRSALAAQVDDLWQWILTLPPVRSAAPDPAPNSGAEPVTNRRSEG
jgi:dephospho-CoA kinase